MTKKLIKVAFDTTGTKHYYYDDGTHTFKGFDGFEYPYRAFKDTLTFHKSKPHRHSKVDGGASTNTYRGFNDNCKRLALNPDNICHYCYVGKFEFPSLVNKLKENTYNLTQRELTPDEINDAVKLMVKKGIKFFRFEAFGDVINAVQVDNYLQVARAIDEQTYIPQAVFTKRPLLWADGFERNGKPDTLKAVYSVPQVNGVDAFIPPSIVANFDYYFVVVTPEYEKANGITVTCGGLECKSCLRCYRDTPDAYVIERLK